MAGWLAGQLAGALVNKVGVGGSSGGDVCRRSRYFVYVVLSRYGEMGECVWKISSAKEMSG